jgi:hypothetical protein
MGGGGDPKGADPAEIVSDDHKRAAGQLDLKARFGSI